MTHATGPRKNILLTLWLLLPFFVVGLLVAGIFRAYSKGPAMHARPIGQGAADTGGANAIGEWLAGNDVIEDEQTRRDLREGRLIDPVDWPEGIQLRIGAKDTSQGLVYAFEWLGRGGRPPSQFLKTGFIDPDDPDSACPVDPSRCYGGISMTHERLTEIFSGGRPGAGLYLSTTETVSVVADRLVDANGTPLDAIKFSLVPRDRVTDGEPIVVMIVP
ncbi:MAG: hypothetical protein K8E66_07900 [Phycisphaerales bacterium]|nr:hypothetical protein [Phycisphaerales bacterium]